MTAPAVARSPRWLPVSADVVFLVLAVVIVQGGRTSMLDDPGLGWHLRNLDAIRAQGWWLTEDPFTFHPQGESRRWLTNQWLGELPLWLGWRWAGEEGIAAVTALVLAFTLRCLYAWMVRDGTPWPTAVLWTSVAAAGTAVSWVARPNIFTMLFLLLTVRVCERFHQDRLSRGQTLWLWPLFMVWANTHGGFLAGLFTLGVTLCVEFLIALAALDVADRRAAARRGLHLALLLTGAVLATLVNPYGIELYRWVFQLIGDRYFMDLNHEWKPPPFRVPGSFRYELVLLMFPAVLAVTQRRPNLVELSLALAWLYLALTGFRYVALWVLVVIPLLARCSLEIPWLQAIGQRWLLTAGEASLFSPRAESRHWLWTAIVAAGLLLWARAAEGQFAGHNPKIIPTAALRRALELHRARPEARIFHAYDWGGYLTWHGWPSLRNWIDDRNEVQGRAHIENWNSIVTAQPGWDKKLDDARAELIVLHADTPLIELLSHPARRSAAAEPEERWREVYRDEFAVIFQRNLRAGVQPAN